MECEVLVIGAGPAGLSAGQYSARSGHDTLIIDPMGPGGQLLFIDEIENYPGKEKVSGFLLSQDFEKQAESFGAKIEYLEAKEIIKDINSFIVKTDGDDIRAKAIIVATGAVHRHLDVKGEEEYVGKGVSYCATCDGPFFKNKDVVVVGGGDTALTDALYLTRLCSSVTIIHRRNDFRAQKVLIDRVKENEKIKLLLSEEISEIIGDGSHVTSLSLKSGKEVKCDGIFIFVGITPSSTPFSSLLDLDNGYIKTNDKMETSVDGIFSAGDVRVTSFRQVVTAASDGAIAAHSADEYIRRLS